MIPAGLCSLFFRFRCLPQACDSHISLCTLTSDHQGQRPPKKFCLLVNYCHKEPPVHIPSPTGALVQLSVTAQKKTLRTTRKGLFICHTKRMFSKCGARPEGMSTAPHGWAWLSEVLKYPGVLLLLSKERQKMVFTPPLPTCLVLLLLPCSSHEKPNVQTGNKVYRSCSGLQCCPAEQLTA